MPPSTSRSEDPGQEPAAPAHNPSTDTTIIDFEAALWKEEADAVLPDENAPPIFDVLGDSSKTNGDMSTKDHDQCDIDDETDDDDDNFDFDFEDEARKRLEPAVKAWSEEHGQKKQLRALLGSLHKILWPDAKWKPVSLGDILDHQKCSTCYKRAALVVHPDRTRGLNAVERFLSKRIFAALSQAKAEFDNEHQ